MTTSNDDHGPAELPPELQQPSVASKLNWLRAGVLGANDGIVSTAGIVVGVAAATVETQQIFTAGIAGLVAGAISMAAGEYVSVSTQRDTEKALMDEERREHAEQPSAERDELAALLEIRGVSPETAQTVADELSERDTFRAHVELELGLDPHELTNPWHAALSSAVSFILGALLPFAAILLPPPTFRIPVTVVATLVALAITGLISARLGRANPVRAALRVTIGGALAMAITFAVGHLVGEVIG